MRPAKQFLAFFTVFFFFSGSAVAQFISAKDSAYVFLLLDKAELFFTDDRYDSALYYCDKAESYSQKINFKKGIAWSLIVSAPANIRFFHNLSSGAVTTGFQIDGHLIGHLISE